MLRRLSALFHDGAARSKTGSHNHGELQLAVAALLVEAARMDGHFDGDERKTIRWLLETRLGFDDAEDLISAAEVMAERAGDFWSFARVAKNRFSHEELVGLVEMLWEVVYADGTLDDFEASLLRRVTGLLYVSDRESGAARKRVLERLGLEGE